MDAGGNIIDNTFKYIRTVLIIVGEKLIQGQTINYISVAERISYLFYGFGY